MTEPTTLARLLPRSLWLQVVFLLMIALALATLFAGPIASRTDGTRTCETSWSSHRSTTSADAPRFTATAAKS